MPGGRAPFKPDLAAAHNNLGNAYAALEPAPSRGDRRLCRGAPPFARARRGQGPRQLLGLALQRGGQFAKALSYLRRAVELDPEDVELCWHLAYAHTDDEDYAAAIPCRGCKIVALEPEQPQGYIDLGSAMLDEGLARRGCRGLLPPARLELQPEDLDALLKQGHLYEELGEMVEAEALLPARAPVSSPGRPGKQPLTCLATLLRGRLPDDDRRAIRTRLGAYPARRRGQRANLLFGLAHACDAVGECAEAVARLEQANALVLGQRRDRNRQYDAAEHARLQPSTA